MGLNGDFWSRLGFVAISLLPPMGIHLAVSLLPKTSTRKLRFLPWVAYLTCSIFIVHFVFDDNGVTFDRCLGNYVIFTMSQQASMSYGLYYYGWLLVGVWLCFAKVNHVNIKLQKVMHWLGAGYLLFMLPTTIVNLIDPSTIDGIPSIMCGFAVLLALVLIFRVAPSSLQPKKFVSSETTE